MLLLLLVTTLKIRYYIISDTHLKFYSFWYPLGKTLDFNDYIGKMIQTETGAGGSYEVIYLVDKCNRTVFKIMGLYYKNFEEMKNAIPLKTIRFTPTKGQYFKLLATGKLNISKRKKSDV